MNPNGEMIIDMQKAGIEFSGGAGVFDLNLSIPRGSIMGMIGPSGCGKTTTVRLLTGALTPTQGKIAVFGKSPSTFQPEDRERIGYIPQQFSLYQSLSVLENMHFVASMYGLGFSGRRRRFKELLEFVELYETRHRLGKQLSGGMQRRLMLAGALIHKPDLLFADEPTAGIDPILRERFWDNFRQLRDNGHTLLITTQYVGEAVYCDYVAVIRKGRLLMVDTPEELRRQAMGGETILLEVDPNQTYKTVHYLDQLPNVIDAETVKGKKNLIHIYVKDVNQELPILLTKLKEDLAITPKSAEPYLPPFDEVFVRIMEKSEEHND